MQIELNQNTEIKNIIYSSNPNHVFINEGLDLGIGKSGNNLTIMVLAMERSKQTILLINSIKTHIPYFEGSLLIVDNGSSETEKEAVRSSFKDMPFKCEMLELDKNYGVAGGRNRGVEHITTEWVLSLDNDIYFVGDPIEAIDHDLAILGCHFLNMPLLDETGKKIFANGGHLNLIHKSDGIHLGIQSMLSQEKSAPNTVYPVSMGTFLYGGSSVFNKNTFLLCGCFDEGFFIGFEDIDFSLSLFRMGYKIGNCGMVALLHDHQKPTDANSAEYEKVRFSEELIKKSAQYFEKKHSFIVWNNDTELWLRNRQKTLELSGSTKSVAKESVRTSKNNPPKIALVVDAVGWAFDNIAKQVEKSLRGHFEFIRLYRRDYESVAQIMFAAKGCDIVHFFWRVEIDLIESVLCRGYIEMLNCSYDVFLDQYVKNIKISTCVYDHMLIDDNDWKQDVDQAIRCISRADSYYVSSYKLEQIYTLDTRFQNPISVLPDGVDLELFSPSNLERFNNLNRTIRIGWVGNSKAVWGKLTDLKGIHTIIEPAVRFLIKFGYDVELVVADRQLKLIPHNEMPVFYNKIDLYVCASVHEGTPNPVLEAMACGVPVISTDVGIVTEAFGSKQSAWILYERSPEALSAMIKKLLENTDMLRELSAENLVSIRAWDWKAKAFNFKEYFDKCLLL